MIGYTSLFTPCYLIFHQTYLMSINLAIINTILHTHFMFKLTSSSSLIQSHQFKLTGSSSPVFTLSFSQNPKYSYGITNSFISSNSVVYQTTHKALVLWLLMKRYQFINTIRHSSCSCYILVTITRHSLCDILS